MAALWLAPLADPTEATLDGPACVADPDAPVETTAGIDTPDAVAEAAEAEDAEPATDAPLGDDVGIFDMAVSAVGAVTLGNVTAGTEASVGSAVGGVTDGTEASVGTPLGMVIDGTEASVGSVTGRSVGTPVGIVTGTSVGTPVGSVTGIEISVGMPVGSVTGIEISVSVGTGGRSVGTTSDAIDDRTEPTDSTILETSVGIGRGAAVIGTDGMIEPRSEVMSPTIEDKTDERTPEGIGPSVGCKIDESAPETSEIID